MNGLRFKVGEMAIVAVAMNPVNQGKVVEIIAVGPFKAGHRVVVNGVRRRSLEDCDYFLDQSPPGGLAHDYQLRKIDPPAEPESITRREECEA